MPLYEYRCESGHSFEELRKVGGRSNPAPCPDCGLAASPRLSTFLSPHAYDAQVEGKQFDKTRPEHISRGGDGGAVMVKETGGYRPSLTHHTECPRHKKWTNVAVLGQVQGGNRVEGECGCQWIHRARDAGSPLVKGAKGYLGAGQKFFGGEVSKYRAAERETK